MLHITDGESVAGTLRESGLPGDVSTYGDLMYEGPAPSGLDVTAWRDTRAGFIAAAEYANLENAQTYLKNCQNTLEAFPHHDEVVIWLDHRLSDQLILIKVLDWFSRQDLNGVKLSMIRIDTPTRDPFKGLGSLPPEQLATYAGSRVQVSKAQYETARAAWSAFTSADPTETERFIRSDTSALPFIAAALRRHLEQFPSLENGLSRTERQALSTLRDQGPLSGPKLFVAVQRHEEAVFMGDLSFYRIMAELAEVRHPLVQLSDSKQQRLGVVTINETGLNVLVGREDHIKLNGIDRWLGGVHLTSGSTLWRWDRLAQTLVAHNV